MLRAHSPGGPQTLPDPQEQVPETPSSRHVRRTLSIGPKAPAAFPVGHAAGVRFRHPSPPPGLMRRRTQSPKAEGIRTEGLTHLGRPRPSPQSPHVPIPTGTAQLEPDRFHPYPRAPAPTPRVSAPMTSPCETPIPRI